MSINQNEQENDEETPKSKETETNKQLELRNSIDEYDGSKYDYLTKLKAFKIDEFKLCDKDILNNL